MRRWPKNLRHCQTASHWSVTTARLQYFELQTSASCTARRTAHFNSKAQTTAAGSPQCANAVKIASVWLQVNENFNTLKKIKSSKIKKITVKMNQKCQFSKIKLSKPYRNKAFFLPLFISLFFSTFHAYTTKIKHVSFIPATALCKEKILLWWYAWDQMPVCHFPAKNVWQVRNRLAARCSHGGLWTWTSVDT